MSSKSDRNSVSDDKYVAQLISDYAYNVIHDYNKGKDFIYDEEDAEMVSNAVKKLVKDLLD